MRITGADRRELRPALLLCYQVRSATDPPPCGTSFFSSSNRQHRLGGSSELKRGAAVGGAAVGLAGLAAFKWEKNADPTDEPKSGHVPSTEHEGAAHPESELHQPMAFREGIAPGSNELPLMIDELIDHADVVTDGVRDGIAVMPVEDGLEHVEQVRDEMAPRLDHWIMPMDEPVPDALQGATPAADSFLVVSEEVVDPFVVVTEEVIDPFGPDSMHTVSEVVIVETEYQSPAPVETTAWILTEGQVPDTGMPNDAIDDFGDDDRHGSDHQS